MPLEERIEEESDLPAWRKKGNPVLEGRSVQQGDFRLVRLLRQDVECDLHVRGSSLARVLDRQVREESPRLDVDLHERSRCLSPVTGRLTYLQDSEHDSEHREKRSLSRCCCRWFMRCESSAC